MKVRGFICFIFIAITLCFYSHLVSSQEIKKTAVRPRLAVPSPIPPKTVMADEDVIRVESSLTSVLMTAIDDKKRFVTNITQDDIVIYENNQPQKIFTFQRETDLPLSVAIVVDISQSQENTLPTEKTAALAFVQTVLRPEKDNFAVLSFSGHTTSLQSLTNNLSALRRAIDSIKIELPPEEYRQKKSDDPGCQVDPRGCSAIWDAAWDTINQILVSTPERTRRAIILLTDGEDTSSQVERDEIAELAVKSNVVIYTIGVGDRENYSVKEGTLKKLSERTGGRAFFPKEDTDLGDAFRQIQQELRSQYLVAYEPNNTLRDGGYRKIKIEITNPELRKQKLRLLYRQGYYASK